MGDAARDLCLRLFEDTRERIRKDHQRASARVVELLVVIEERLLDPNLDVNELLRECGQRDQNISTRFAAELGLGPDAYIRVLRLELAGRMLVASDFKVWRIAFNIGYVTPGSFNRAFKKWYGKNPSAFRRDAKSGSAESSAPAELLDQDELRQALNGELPAERARALASRLHELGEQIFAGQVPSSMRQDGTLAVESAMARGLWEWIEELPYELQLGAIKSQAPHYRTLVLFNRLCTVSVEAEDDVRAMKLAMLAMTALNAMEDRVGDDYLNAFARAWAVAGLGYCRVGKLEEAARDLDKAAGMLAMAGKDAHPVIVAELCFYKARLEVERENFEEAEKLSADGGAILQQAIADVRASGEELDWQEIEGEDAGEGDEPSE